MSNQITDFINNRFSNDCDWLNGNCFYFASILHIRFPQLTIIYLPITGHFMAADLEQKKYYDYNGLHINLSEPYYIWDNLEQYDSSLYHKLIRDCIL